MKSMMPRAYQDLPEEFFFGVGSGNGCIYLASGAEEGIKRHTGWAKEPFEQSTYNLKGRKHLTSAGFRVRSKSEQHIVEQLVNYGIPFRYEQVLHIGQDRFAPDFTFRDRYLELFRWEHAGMMNDPFYCARHKEKMLRMEDAGIVPWKNLIVTYDVDDSINIMMIKSIIENEIIPRL